MPDWHPPLRPTAYAEQSLISAILSGHYPPGSTLPGERDLAIELGVTRPTLREALQRMERDGWLTIQQGKPTQVNDFWQQGGLNVLGALVRFDQVLPPDFIDNLLEVRLVLAPAYVHLAVTRQPQKVSALLASVVGLDEDPQAFAAFDWRLHHSLTIFSGNPIYTLILNGFAGFYQQLATNYFAYLTARQVSRQFYDDLGDAAAHNDALSAEKITRRVMQESLRLWALQSKG